MHTKDSTPPPLEDIVRQLVDRRRELERLGAEHVDVFGSCARGEQKRGSDVDLIVHLRSGYGYFDLGRMKMLLERQLGVEVNPIAESGISKGSIAATYIVNVF